MFNRVINKIAIGDNNHDNNSQNSSQRSVISVGRQTVTSMQAMHAEGRDGNTAASTSRSSRADIIVVNNGQDEMRLMDTRRKYATIESLIGHPICCGYLLKFCQSEYNAENLNFLLEVDEFRDSFVVDVDVWLDTWREVDERVNFLTDAIDVELMDEVWPSAANKQATFSRINALMAKFIVDDAPEQVCIPEELIRKTKKRICLFHLYGPELFEEACLDPIKTLRKDTLPRFIRSPFYTSMIHLVASCDPPPLICEIAIHPPDSTQLLSSGPLAQFPKSRKYQLDEVISCGPMYEQFMEYLEKNMCAENLKCVRMIAIFESLMAQAQSQGDEDVDDTAAVAAIQHAWDVFRFFVASGSAYEVSCHHLVRKRVMLTLASPVPGMFDAVRKSALDTLGGNFDAFRRSPAYDKLGEVMRSAKLALDRKATRGGADGAAGLKVSFLDRRNSKDQAKPKGQLVVAAAVAAANSGSSGDSGNGGDSNRDYFSMKSAPLMDERKRKREKPLPAMGCFTFMN